MEKTIPIKNQMNGVFIHVSNLAASAKWYCDLIGADFDKSNAVSPVFNIPVNGTTSLTLDDHSFDPGFAFQPSKGPVFNFYAPEIDAAYEYAKEKGIEIAREIEWAGDTAWFNIKDPDGNIIMIANC